MFQTGRSVQLSNTPADLELPIASETRRTIERNSFEIPARVKKDPILNHSHTNNGKQCSLRRKTPLSRNVIYFYFLHHRTNRKDLGCLFKFLINVQTT